MMSASAGGRASAAAAGNNKWSGGLVAWAASSWEDCDCDSDVGEHGVPLQPATNVLATNDQEVCNWAAVVVASSADCDCHRDAGR